MSNEDFDRVFTEEVVRKIYQTARNDAADDLKDFYERIIKNVSEGQESEKIIKEWTTFIINGCIDIVRGPQEDLDHVIL